MRAISSAVRSIFWLFALDRHDLRLPFLRLAGVVRRTPVIGRTRGSLSSMISKTTPMYRPCLSPESDRVVGPLPTDEVVRVVLIQHLLNVVLG